MGRRRIVLDSDDDIDYLPPLRPRSPEPTYNPSTSSTEASRPLQLQQQVPERTLKPNKKSTGDNAATTPIGTVRRRKLGKIGNDTSLLRPLGATEKFSERSKLSRSEMSEIRRNSFPRPTRSNPRIELRSTRTIISEMPADDAGELFTEEGSLLEDMIDGDGKGYAVVRDNSKTYLGHGTGQNANKRTNDGESNCKQDGGGQNGPLQEEEDERGGRAEQEYDDSCSNDSEFEDPSFCSDSSFASLGDYFAQSPRKCLASTQEGRLRPQKNISSLSSRPPNSPRLYTDEGSSVYFSAEESFSYRQQEAESHVDQ